MDLNTIKKAMTA